MQRGDNADALVGLDEFEERDGLGGLDGFSYDVPVIGREGFPESFTTAVSQMLGVSEM